MKTRVIFDSTQTHWLSVVCFSQRWKKKEEIGPISSQSGTGALKKTSPKEAGGKLKIALTK